MDGQEQVVTAHEFRLVDRAGRLRALLGASPESEPGLIFCDEVGRVGVELTLREDGASSLLLSDAAGEMRAVLGAPPAGAPMGRAGTSRAIIATAVAFLGTGAAAAVMILLWAPTLSPYRLVTLLASMFAVTAGIVTATVAWACSERQENH